MAEVIEVVQGPMGSGKTQFAIQEMAFRHRSFIYVTPYISEVERVCRELDKYDVQYQQPTVGGNNKNKSASFRELLTQGASIVTTHSLFDRLDEKTLSLIGGYEYDLYLDEVFDVVNTIDDISPDDLALLLNKHTCEVDEDDKVVWLDEEYDGKFNKLKNMCNLGEVYKYSNKLLVYNFPIKVFDKMKEVKLFTFGFEGQVQYGYYKFYKKKMEFYTVQQDEVIPCWYNKKEYDRDKMIQGFSEVMDKIHIYDGKLNFDKEESKRFPLSSTAIQRYIKNGGGELKAVQNSLYSYFRNNEPKVKTSELLWTTLKPAKSYLKGKGYTKGFIPLNLRATNDYDDRVKLAYVFDKYFNPIQKNFLSKKGIKLDQDRFALVELLQWVFRSRIRRGEEIWLYIPNYRMRNLLENWREYI